LEEFRAKVEILSNHNLLGRKCKILHRALVIVLPCYGALEIIIIIKCAAVCRKIATSCMPLLLFKPTTPPAVKTDFHAKALVVGLVVMKRKLLEWGSELTKVHGPPGCMEGD